MTGVYDTTMLVTYQKSVIYFLMLELPKQELTWEFIVDNEIQPFDLSVAKSGIASGLGPEDRRFESYQIDQF